MAVEFRELWDLLKLPDFAVTDFWFFGSDSAGPQLVIQLDSTSGDGRRYLAFARVGNWPDVNWVFALAYEHLQGGIDLVWVPAYPEQKGLRFWYARGLAKTGGEGQKTGCISTIRTEPNR